MEAPSQATASSMAGAEEIYTVPEQEREPQERDFEDPSKDSEAQESHSFSSPHSSRSSRFSRSSRAGLLFSVSRVDRQLRRGCFAERYAAQVPVYLAAVLQCMTHKALEMAGRISKKSKRRLISPSHLQVVVQKSSVLKQLLRGAVLSHCGQATPQRQRAASPSKKETKTRRKKRSPRQKAAPARAAATGK